MSNNSYRKEYDEQGNQYFSQQGTVEITEANEDLNNYINEGKYYFSSSKTPENIPAGVNGWLEVITHDTNVIKQIWYRQGTPDSNDYETYIRTKSGNAWSNWIRLATLQELQLGYTGYFNGSTTSINDLNTNGCWRGYIQSDSNESNYLGWSGNTIVQTFNQANSNPIIQILTQMTTGRQKIRYCANSSFSYNDTLLEYYLPLTGGTLTGNLFLEGNKIHFGNGGNVEWKENGYGDKFRIIPEFNGADDDNKLKIQGTVGGAQTDPTDWVDVGTISAKNRKCMV